MNRINGVPFPFTETDMMVSAGAYHELHVWMTVAGHPSSGRAHKESTLNILKLVHLRRISINAPLFRADCEASA